MRTSLASTLLSKDRDGLSSAIFPANQTQVVELNLRLFCRKSVYISEIDTIGLQTKGDRSYVFTQFSISNLQTAGARIYARSAAVPHDPGSQKTNECRAPPEFSVCKAAGSKDLKPGSIIHPG
jgi:hypothetical protein